jgi:hypothetical protein
MRLRAFGVTPYPPRGRVAAAERSWSERSRARLNRPRPLQRETPPMPDLTPEDRKMLSRLGEVERQVVERERPRCVTVTDDGGLLTLLNHEGVADRVISEIPDADDVIMVPIIDPNPTEAQRNYYVRKGYWTTVQENEWKDRQERIARGEPENPYSEDDRNPVY